MKVIYYIISTALGQCGLESDFVHELWGQKDLDLDYVSGCYWLSDLRQSFKVFLRHSYLQK